MADDWRVRECANQLLLFVALEARDAMVGSQGMAIPAPVPLPPFDDVRGKQDIRDLRDRVAANPVDVDPVRRFMTLVASLPRRGKDVTLIRDQPPWLVGDVVQWWIRAGCAVADWTWERLSFGEREPESHLAVDGKAPEEWLFEAMSRRLQLEDDEEHVPFWCAAHVRPWRLEPDGGEHRPAAWHAPATSHEDCLAALLEWCGDPRREGGPLIDGPPEQGLAERWAADYRDRYRDFARSSLRLLRRRCVYGRVGEIQERLDHWAVYRGDESPRRPRVLRPPVYVADGATHHPAAAGWVVAPWPAVLVEQFQRDAESRPPVARSVARAIARARVWGRNDTRFGPVRPPAEALSAGDGDALMTHADRLVAVGSLATAVELSSSREAVRRSADDPAGLDVRERVLWSMMVEGIGVRRQAESDAGGGRVIPLSPGFEHESPEGTPVLTLACDDSPDPIVVGSIGHAARCHDGLLAAVEDLDWSWWALRVIGADGRGDERLEGLVALADEIAWEQLKRRLLDVESVSEATRDSLADAHRGLHAARLRIERQIEGGQAAGIVCRLVRQIEAVEATICDLLASADPDGFARLDPPRTADGRIAIAAVSMQEWMEKRSCIHGWNVIWERSADPFGTVLRETLGNDGLVCITVSAGEQATDADVRLLAAPGVVAGSDLPDAGAFLEPLRVRVHAALVEAAAPDIAAGISEIRTGFDGPHAATFDRLLAGAIDGQPCELAWVRLAHADPRFAFASHPGVDVAETGVAVHPAVVDDVLEWQDHDKVPDGGDIEIRFATDPSRSRRIVSRGRPADQSAEAHAARLVATVAAGPAELVAAATALRLATDRRRMFGAAATDPIVDAVEVANDLVVSGPGLGDAAVAAFRELLGWCAAGGFTLVPREWHPAHGAAADGLAVERVGFHPTVPEDRVVVERFGAATHEGEVVATLEAYLSAGPAPAGYADVVEQAAALADDGEAVARFRRCVLEFPKRVSAGQVATAAAGLFDVAWKAVVAAPERADLRQAAATVQRLLDRSYDMIVFEPKSVGDYQESWLRTPEGKPPRGLRVNRLVRPGLRTLDNKLVWPAIVEMG
jgi:hypothetical protein